MTKVKKIAEQSGSRDGIDIIANAQSQSIFIAKWTVSNWIILQKTKRLDKTYDIRIVTMAPAFALFACINEH